MNKRNSIRFGKSNDLDRQTAVPECGKNIIRRKSEGKEKLKRDFDFDDHLFIRQHVSFVAFWLIYYPCLNVVLNNICIWQHKGFGSYVRINNIHTACYFQIHK